MPQVNVMRTDKYGNVFWLLDTGRVQLKLPNRPPKDQLKDIGYFNQGVFEVKKPAKLIFRKADAVCFNHAVIEYLGPTDLILHLTTTYRSESSGADYLPGWYHLSVDSPTAILEKYGKLNFKNQGYELQVVIPLDNFYTGESPGSIWPKTVPLSIEKVSALCGLSGGSIVTVESNKWCTVTAHNGVQVDIVTNPIYVRSPYYIMASELEAALFKYPLNMKSLVKKNALK